MAGLEPTVPCSQGTWGAAPLHPALCHFVNDPDHPAGGARIRTQPGQLERLATSPEVERAIVCAHSQRDVGREALESSSPGLQPGATPSQLPTHAQGGHRSQRKQPDVLVTPGCGVVSECGRGVTGAESDRTPDFLAPSRPVDEDHAPSAGIRSWNSTGNATWK